jgi:hypothetical protein
VVAEEQHRYQQMVDFVNNLDSDWFLFTFEDMVNGKFDALNNYLQFEVQADAGVPSASGKAKVIRKKSTGDWRHWFTETDVEIFKPAYTPYMELIGYDCGDWALDPRQTIEPEYSSVYMQNLPSRVTKNITMRYVDSLVQRWFKKG